MTDETSFLRSVKNHKVTVELDNGVHRSIHFGNPRTSNYHFRLVTWPGHLAISGDSEDFIFTRLTDMFEFFRGDRINPSYWQEKASAVARNGGLQQYDHDNFKQVIVERFRQIDRELFLEGRMVVWSEVRETLLENEFGDAREAIAAASDMYFLHRRRGDRRGAELFPDIWDHNFNKPSFQFLWACHAIQWGIKKYDQLKDGNTQKDHDRKVLEGVL